MEEDFKYTFDLFGLDSRIIDHDFYPLLIGYIYLHQLVMQDIPVLGNDEIERIFKISMEEGESIEIKDDSFTLKVKEVTDEIIDFVRFVLKYSLILYTDFKVNGNIITFKRIYDETAY